MTRILTRFSLMFISGERKRLTPFLYSNVTQGLIFFGNQKKAQFFEIEIFFKFWKKVHDFIFNDYKNNISSCLSSVYVADDILDYSFTKFTLMD